MLVFPIQTSEVQQMKQIAKEYFRAFSQKNTKKLGELYSDDISLVDWVSSATGKENVLNMNNELFGSFDDIRIDVNEMYKDESVVACEIDIFLDKQNKRTCLKVVDVLEFDAGRIVSIRAYLGGEKEETKVIDGNMGPYDYDV
jgi:ketosteroid isomerase-like protein